MAESQSESAGVVKCSESGVVVIPVEVRKVLGIEDQEAFLRVEDISVAQVIEDDTTLDEAKGGDS